MKAPYTSADRQRWRQALLAKGKEISDQLAEVLAGKDITLAEISLFANDGPAEKKEVRLRRYFDHVMGRMRNVEGETFGFCEDEERFHTREELDEVPWL